MADTTNIFERWRADPASFIETLIDPDTGRGFVLLFVERTFLQHMFKFDANGRLLYSDLIYAAMKKSGKTTWAAILIIVTVLLFGGRNAEAYCVANDLEQAQGRVFEMVRRIVEATSFLKNATKITADRIVFPSTNAVITAIASDYASAAGGHPTIVVFDEIWAFTSERGRRLWDELVPVPTRKVSCRLVVTYAGFEGESELLLDLYRRGVQQPEIGTDLHAGDGVLMFWSHQPMAPWQDEQWLAQMRRSLRPNQYLRMIENRCVAAESTFIDLSWWDACIDPQAKPILNDPYLEVYRRIGKTGLHCARCCDVSQKNQSVKLVNHKIIQPTADNPIDFEATVEATLLDWEKRYNLRACYYDPYQLVSSAQRLTKEGIMMHEFPQTVPNLTESSQNLFDLIKGKNFSAYPDEAIRLAVSRAVAIETPRGWRVGKNLQSHKVDVVVALGMASLAAVKQEVGTEGYSLAVLLAANDEAPPAPDDLDNSREWRDKRCPPEMTMEEWVRLTGVTRPTSGPDALGSAPLGNGAYRAASSLERWELEARIRARETATNGRAV